MKDSTEDTTEPVFEQGLKRLENIVKQLEKGDLPLAKSLELFEEGTALNGQLADTLDAAEARIEKLTRHRDGSLRTETLEIKDSQD